MHELVDRARRAAVAAGPARIVASGLGVVVAAVVAWWLLRPAPTPIELQLPRAEATSSAPSSRPPATTAVPRSAPSAGDTIVVQIAGAVARPGVYRMPAASRVVDLIDAAGGPSPDADPSQLRLAALLADGDRIVVPRPGEAVDVGPSPSLGAPSGPVDLNRATVAELDALPGVGPATAAAILAHREQIGRFRSVDELADVRGIGEAKLEALRPLVTVGP